MAYITDTQLADETGASLVGFAVGAIDDVARTAEAKLREQPLTPQDFSATVATGSDDTAVMKAFYDACIAEGRAGHIPAGVYRIQVGQLLFDNGNYRKAWPEITTDGFDRVTFLGTGTADKPILEWRNGDYQTGRPQDSVDRYWVGGCHGGVTFKLAQIVSNVVNRHGIMAYGMYGVRFGRMLGKELQGSTFHLTFKESTVAGLWTRNPDPHAMTFCVWEGVEGISNRVRSFDNQNGVGLNVSTIESVRGIHNLDGVLFGLGAANTFRNVSCGDCGGVAVDSSLASGGQIRRSIVEQAELDAPQIGIRIANAGDVSIQKTRIVHRHNAAAGGAGVNKTGGFWPEIAIDILPENDPSLPPPDPENPAQQRIKGACRDVVIETTHRIHEVAGLAQAELGEFVHLHSASASILNLKIDQAVLMQPPSATSPVTWSIPDTALYTGLNANSQVRFRRDGKVILDTIPNNSFTASRLPATGMAVGTSGFGTLTSALRFNQQRVDRGGVFLASTEDVPPASVEPGAGIAAAFVTPYLGQASFNLCLPLVLPAGTKVELGLLRERDGVLMTVASRAYYAASNSRQTYELSQTLDSLQPLDKIYAIAVQNSGAAVTASASAYNLAEIVFQGRMI